MIVAFDLDETLTEDPYGWAAVIETLVSRGHECVVCTFRAETHREEVEAWLAGHGIPCPHTSPGVARSGSSWTTPGCS